MKLLTSKIQHYNFEEGEFVEEKKRSYAEVIEIIEEFPWELEREFLVVDLTNPSVSISGLNFDYLKLSLYYNGKFVLHYFDRDDVLYSKSFFDIKDSHRYISEFFQDKLTLSDFRKQNTWLQKNKPHFESADFVYTVTAERVKKYLWSTSAISFAGSIFMVFLFVGKQVNMIMIGVFLFFFFTVGGAFNLILFFNYYFYTKDKILSMSKANDMFYYGNKAAPILYDKKDIIEVKIIQLHHRTGVGGFALCKITMSDGKTLKIPNIFIGEDYLINKLYSCFITSKTSFPFIKY